MTERDQTCTPQLPQRVGLERELLARLTESDNGVFAEALGKGLEASAFSGLDRPRIFRCLKALFDRGEPVGSTAAIEDELRRNSCHAACLPELVRLPVLDRGVANLDYLVAAVTDTATLRGGWQEIENISSLLGSGEIDSASDLLSHVTSLRDRLARRQSSTYGCLISAIDRHQIQPSQSIVDGILNRNQLSLLFGPAGVGKSQIATSLACSVAEWGNVVYILAEAHEEMPPRLDAISARFNLAFDDRLWLFPEPLRLADPGSVQRFIAEVAPKNPLLIAIDPLANCLVGLDENSTNDMTLAIDVLNRIRKETGASLQIVHHSGRDGTHERGSTVLRGACRLITQISADDDVIRVSVVKQNSGRPIDDRFFRIVEVLPADIPNYDPRHQGKYTVLMRSSRVADEFGTLSKRQIEVLEILAWEVFRHGARNAQIAENGIPKNTVSKAVSNLIRRGLVQNDAGVFNLTITGREIANSLLNGGSDLPQNSSEQLVNWPISEEFRSSLQGSLVSPAVHGSSLGVHPVFPTSGSHSVHSPLPIGSELVNSGNGTQREGDYTMDEVENAPAGFFPDDEVPF